MKKCDSCGKIITDTRDKMCPYCGAVAYKSEVCTHEEDRWNRADDTYSFHGEQKHNNEPTPEDNINRMFSFGSEELKEKVKKIPTPKTQSKTKNPKGGLAIFIIFLIIASSFVINFFDSDDPYDVGDGINCEISDVTVSVNEDGLLCFNINPDSVYSDEDYSDDELIQYADKATYCYADVREIPLVNYKAGEDYYEFYDYYEECYFNEAEDDTFVSEDFYVSDDACYIAFGGFMISDGTDCLFAELPFDAVKIENGKITYYYAQKGNNDYLKFTPVGEST